MNFDHTMTSIINVETSRANLPAIVKGVRKGDRYTVLYRSRPAFRIVPVEDDGSPSGPLAEDPLYRAGAVGSSKDGRAAADHDDVLYRR